MADFVQALDPSKLVLVETILSFITSAFNAPSYNLPIFLFGSYAQESSEAVQSLKTFTLLVAVSAVYDIIYMARNSQNWFIRLVTILILILKIPTGLAFAAALRQRGTQFPGLGAGFGNNVSGATVWSMPGGFTSSNREGYQSVDEPESALPPKPATAPPVNQPNAPGAYQSV
ncbi:hypothetical protein K474DRAFT_1706070 [Panus rudis PR-1116 ss-1]|nr:hypothetical protein K474DRAFT_1706070 [Panus rudis PR-1116 ss-1]